MFLWLLLDLMGLDMDVPSSVCLHPLWYLADDGELWSVDVVAVDPQRKHCSQRHHAAHRRHVVQVGLGVLDVAGT